MKRCLPLLLLLPLALNAEDRHTYHCDNGSRLAMSFTADADGRPQATLHFADGEVVLPQVPAATGSRYRRDPVSLQLQGEDALIEDGKDNRRHCSREAPPAATGSFVDVAGDIRYRSRQALPASAELVIRVRSRGIMLAEQRYRLAGASGPIPFTATVDRDLLGAPTLVAAHIEVAGRSRFRGEGSYSPEQRAPLTIELHPLPDPPGKRNALPISAPHGARHQF